MTEESRKLWKFYTVIKKVFKLINSKKNKSLNGKRGIITGIGPKSTPQGRKRVEHLKKIGKKKREES